MPLNMARRKVHKGRFKKKRHVKRRFHRRGNVVKEKGLIIANETLAKLRYVDTTSPTLTMTAAVNTNVTNVFYCNGLYDVNSAIGSTAIPGFAEWMTFYQNYRVMWCRFDCYFVNTTAQPVICGIHIPPVSNTSSPANWTQFMELQGNKNTKMITLSSNGGQDRGKISVYCYLPSLFGDKNTYKADDNFLGSATSNPPSIIRSYVFAITSSGNAPAANSVVNVNTRIKFGVRFMNRKLLYS